MGMAGAGDAEGDVSTSPSAGAIKPHDAPLICLLYSCLHSGTCLIEMPFPAPSAADIDLLLWGKGEGRVAATAYLKHLIGYFVK